MSVWEVSRVAGWLGTVIIQLSLAQLRLGLSLAQLSPSLYIFFLQFSHRFMGFRRQKKIGNFFRIFFVVRFHVPIFQKISLSLVVEIVVCFAGPAS